MSVEIDSVSVARTEVVLDGRGARGVNGTVTVVSASGQAVSSRVALAAIVSPVNGQTAILTETGRDGTFVFDTSNLLANVTADPAQAIYVAPAAAPTGASGAWVRRYSGPKIGSWFGMVADGAAASPTDNAIAFQRFLDAKGWLHLPTGDYYSSSRPQLRNFVIWKGEGFGFDARLVTGTATAGWDLQPGTVIHYPAGSGGLDIQPQTTVTDVATAVAAGTGGYTQEGALHSYISDIAFVGAGTGAAATGVYCRTLVHMHNVHCLKFQGKGFDFSGSSDFSDGNSEFGNPSLSTLTSCRAIQNGSHGLHIRGRDANGMTVINFWSQLNGGWGFFDQSLLGNNYTGGQAAGNTAGAYKCIGTVAVSTFTACYVEADAHANCEISSQCIINGGYLGTIAAPGSYVTNAAADKPTVIGGAYSNFTYAGWQSAQSNLGAISGHAYVYRHSDQGLVHHGAGGTYSHTFRNASDVAVFQIGNTNTNAYFAGTISINGQQVLTTRQAPVSNPVGGVTIDAEARTAINGINAILATHGLAA